MVVDERSEREKIKEVCEISPNIRVAVFAQTFVVKAVHLRDLPRLVVPSEDGDTVAISKLECHEQSDCFYRIVPPINIVAHEEVVRVW